MKKLLMMIGFATLSFAHAQAQVESLKINTNTDKMAPHESIYSLKATDISGEVFNFGSLRGKKIMIVNTASECGLTPQYKELEEIYNKYKGLGLVIVGFPANNFGEQEPGTNKEIAAFCQKNYGVTFPMMEKISVVGSDMHPVYKYLTDKNKNGHSDSEVKWNFQKYLINEQGQLEKVVPSQTSPSDPEITNWIRS
ncbi:MAG TPA: glutathione peroxidase [Flavobacterium sp.]|jgi:glutathione peroxidase